MSAYGRAMAMALAVLSAPATAQGPSGGSAARASIDLTGAGTLVLGDIDAVLRPHRRALDRADGRLPLRLTLAPSGAVIACEGTGGAALAEATGALCAHALDHGRFEPFAYLKLEFSEATYHVAVSARDGGKGPYRLETGYPDGGAAVRFGEYRIPPPPERLSVADLQVTPMSYPRSALSRGYEARVVVALTFGADGRVARCEPVSSSNSSRMAYETCRAAYRAYRLLSPPDPRPYVMATNWRLAD